MNARKIILLGPQRLRPTLKTAVDSLDLDPAQTIAAVTAGWQEREPEDLELGDHLGGPVVNLRLYERAEDVFRRDPELRQAMQQRYDQLRALQQLHRLRLSPTLQAARDLLADTREPELVEAERDDAIDAVRRLDAHHLARVAEIHAAFEDRHSPTARDAVVRHRHELEQTLASCSAVCIAGGHVAILLNRLRLFDLLDLCGDRPLVAWSAGAMVLAERIVLFHDSPPQGAGDAELLGAGLGTCPGVVPLPHASDRLRLDDPTRVALFARRFAPGLCAAFDPETRLDWQGQRWIAAPGTRMLTAQGTLEEAAA